LSINQGGLLEFTTSTTPRITCGDRASGVVQDLHVTAPGTSQASTQGGRLRLRPGRSGATPGTYGRGSLDGNRDGSTFDEALAWSTSGSAPLLAFYGTNPAAKPTVTGSRGGNAALASLLTALAGLGLLTDSSSA
jgi:hypothetical protein